MFDQVSSGLIRNLAGEGSEGCIHFDHFHCSKLTRLWEMIEKPNGTMGHIIPPTKKGWGRDPPPSNFPSSCAP